MSLDDFHTTDFRGHTTITIDITLTGVDVRDYSSAVPRFDAHPTASPTTGPWEDGVFDLDEKGSTVPWKRGSHLCDHPIDTSNMDAARSVPKEQYAFDHQP